MSLCSLSRCTARTYASAARLAALPQLASSDLDTFRAQAFTPAVPALLPRGHFKSYPAASKWFEQQDTRHPRLNTSYLAAHGSVTVPLEITTCAANNGGSREQEQTFARTDRPLSEFLAFVTAASVQPGAASPLQIYLAQCSLSSLPAALQADLPTPALVAQADRGDIYDSSIWIGLAPTYTPLHKDPNPNLFVQLAGTKAVRVFEPAVGAELFAEARKSIGAAGSAAFRGEEMMQGAEKEALDAIVWGSQQLGVGFEAIVDAGDGVFIPKGWWHSIKGTGEGIVGSVGSCSGLLQVRS